MAWYEKDKYKECCHNDACESFDTCIECWDEWAERNPPMTNADHIRAMSDEELAKALYGMQKEVCRHIVKAFDYELEQVDFADEAPDILDWLKAPYKENEE